MTTEQSPATKLGDLIEQLESSIDQYKISTSEALARAYATGTDWQLEACCDYLTRCAAWEPEDIQEMRDLFRPKPPSLKEQALAELDLLKADATTHGLGFDAPAIRRALESLPN